MTMKQRRYMEDLLVDLGRKDRKRLVKMVRGKAKLRVDKNRCIGTCYHCDSNRSALGDIWDDFFYPNPENYDPLVCDDTSTHKKAAIFDVHQ